MELTIDNALQKAVEAHKAGEVQEADRLYTAILKAQPKHPDANHNLGVLAVGVGKVDTALPFLKTALEANPEVAQFWLSYIDALIKMNRITDAKALMDQAKSKGAKGDGFDKLDQRLQTAGQVPLEADMIAEKPHPKQPNILDSLKPDQAINLAKEKVQDGALEEAKRIYRDILWKFPKNQRAKDGLEGLERDANVSTSKIQDPAQDHVQSLMNLYSRGQLEQAVIQANTLIKQFPNSAILFSIQGVVLKGLGKLELSIEAYKKALAIKPDNSQAYNNMGVSLQEQGKLEEAIEAYKKALAIKPDYAEPYNNLGNSHKELGKPKEAIEEYKKALAIKPDYADAYYNMGIALKEQGKPEEALEAYKKALAIKPDNSQAYNNMGNAHKELGKPEEAIEEYKKALAIKPDYTEAYYNMGNALKELGKPEEAIEEYKKALAIKPDYVEAYNNMGNALKELGKLEEAVEPYKKALAIKPDNSQTYNNMGSALKELGKLEEAIEAYKKALAIKPNNSEALENSQILLVQLMPNIGSYGNDFDSIEAQVNSEIVLGPKYQIQNAIKAYLEGDFNRADSHNNNYKACDQNLLVRLLPKDKVFCDAYSSFIGKLLDANWDEEHSSENKVYHLGESHSLSYAHRNITIAGLNYKIAPRMTFGAKAYHFSRPKYDAYKAITKAHLVSLPKSSKVFLSYGEIDCRPSEGFISAAYKLNKPLEELIDETANGYVEWFLKQNKFKRHHLFFLNVPAPVYDENLTNDCNSEVARTVMLFNTALKKYSLQHNFDTVDVFKFTAGKDGFSNGLFHVDKRHLGAKALEEIQRQLS